MIASPGVPDQAWPPPRTARRVMASLRNLSQLGPARFGRGTGFRRPMAERDQKNAPPRRGKGSEAKRLRQPRRARDLDRHPGLGRFGNDVGVRGLAKEQDADHEGHHRHDDRVPEPRSRCRRYRPRGAGPKRRSTINCRRSSPIDWRAHRGDAAVFPRPTRHTRSSDSFRMNNNIPFGFSTERPSCGDRVRGREAPHVTCLAYALTFAGTQMLILRVSGIRMRASTKHTAGTAIG
jgi:hypothetical protein